MISDCWSKPNCIHWHWKRVDQNKKKTMRRMTPHINAHMMKYWMSWRSQTRPLATARFFNVLHVHNNINDNANIHIWWKIQTSNLEQFTFKFRKNYASLYRGRPSHSRQRNHKSGRCCTSVLFPTSGSTHRHHFLSPNLLQIWSGCSSPQWHTFWWPYGIFIWK